MSSKDLRTVPRFPLPKEKMKFVFEDGEKIFAVRDISSRGLGISLLEFGESVLFPEGYKCHADLRLEGEPLLVAVKVVRVNAWSVGFVFEDLSEEQQAKIDAFIDPMNIGSSLRLVDKEGVPEAFLQGMSAWYHGDSGADFFFWNDNRGGLQKALLCLGKRYWEWSDSGGVATGEVQRLEGDKVALHRDQTPDASTRGMGRKVLEHAEVLDYRLVSFLRERT